MAKRLAEKIPVLMCNHSERTMKKEEIKRYGICGLTIEFQSGHSFNEWTYFKQRKLIFFFVGSHIGIDIYTFWYETNNILSLFIA